MSAIARPVQVMVEEQLGPKRLRPDVRRALPTTKRFGHCLAVLTLTATAVLACGDRPPSLEPAPTTIVDPTGILIVDVGERVQSGPVTRRFADALEDALELAEANGADVGYPWFDPETEELVLSVVTPRGRQLVDGVGITVPHRTREVTHGAAELRRIQDDVTFLGQRGVDDAELIFMTLPDHRDNRALIVMSAMSRPLLEYLAEHYPADAIAVQVDPDFVGAGPG